MKKIDTFEVIILPKIVKVLGITGQNKKMVLSKNVAIENLDMTNIRSLIYNILTEIQRGHSHTSIEVDFDSFPKLRSDDSFDELVNEFYLTTGVKIK